MKKRLYTKWYFPFTDEGMIKLAKSLNDDHLNFELDMAYTSVAWGEDSHIELTASN